MEAILSSTTSRIKQVPVTVDLFEQGSGRMLTGFHKLADGRTVYYKNNGQMAHGELKIGSGWTWYNFDKNTGAMKTGFQYIPEYKKTVYYAANGQMQYGEQKIKLVTMTSPKMNN